MKLCNWIFRTNPAVSSATESYMEIFVYIRTWKKLDSIFGLLNAKVEGVVICGMASMENNTGLESFIYYVSFECRRDDNANIEYQLVDMANFRDNHLLWKKKKT